MEDAQHKVNAYLTRLGYVSDVSWQADAGAGISRVFRRPGSWRPVADVNGW
jgi:hypothetical protein